MKCAMAREQLLAAEHPDRPGEALAGHLSRCRECRAMQWRLERLDRDLPRLPVPACPPPAALFEQVLHGQELNAGAVVRTPRVEMRPDRRQGARQKLALAFALAASLAVFAMSWGAWSRQDVPRPPTLGDEYARRVNRKLQDGRQPGEKLQKLTDLADEFVAEAKTADAGGLEKLATQVEWLAARDLPQCAGRVPVVERAKVLGEAADRMQKLESAAAWQQAKRSDPREALLLERISVSLGKAYKHLHDLARASA